MADRAHTAVMVPVAYRLLRGAYVLSSLALAGLVMTVAISTGGIESFAAIWLVLVPLEAALSASRRAVAFASALALSCAGLLIVLGYFDVLPAPESSAVFAASVWRSASRRRRSMPPRLHSAPSRWRAPACRCCMSRRIDIDCWREHERRDFSSSPQRRGAVHFDRGGDDAGRAGAAALRPRSVRARPRRRSAGLSYRTFGRGARREECSVEFRLRRDAPRGERGQGNQGDSVDFIWVEMRCRPSAGFRRTASPEAEVVAVMRDVTDRKIQEQALDQARADAEQADVSKSRFLATMSHELRTPLNAIIGFSEMIVQEDALMLDAARRKEYAQLINDSGQHLLRWSTASSMSKMESGSFEILPEPFAPRAALLDCCNLLALKAGKTASIRDPRARGCRHDRRSARVPDHLEPRVQRRQIH